MWPLYVSFFQTLAGGSDSCSVVKKLLLSATMGETEACLFSPVAPAGTWIKHWLSTHFRPKHSLEEGSQSERCSSHPFCTRKSLVVALLVILALVVMMLLLLLNYYCIMVWHLCKHEESVLPVFQNTTPELDWQDWDVTHLIVFVLIFGAPIWDAFMFYAAVFFVWWTEITLKISIVRFFSGCVILKWNYLHCQVTQLTF